MLDTEVKESLSELPHYCNECLSIHKLQNSVNRDNIERLFHAQIVCLITSDKWELWFHVSLGRSDTTAS